MQIKNNKKHVDYFAMQQKICLQDQLQRSWKLILANWMQNDHSMFRVKAAIFNTHKKQLGKTSQQQQQRRRLRRQEQQQQQQQQLSFQWKVMKC